MHYIFGDYILDLLHYELRQAGRPIPVKPRVFDVLAYLVQHPGQTMTTEELLAQLYPNQFAPVAWSTNTVAQARKVLGDSSQTPRDIQTVRRRGYRSMPSRIRLIRLAPASDVAPGATPRVWDRPVAPRRQPPPRPSHLPCG